MSYSILDDTFCYYCQEEFGTPRKLQNHIHREHKGTYAEDSIDQAKEARRRESYVAPPDEL
jgi:hypothetical protein